jgi:hypothetical protein
MGLREAEAVKDTPVRAFFPGYVAPALLMLLALVNVVTRRAYWPKRHGPIAVYTDGWRVCGSVALEVGLAVGLFAWYTLANDDRREHLAQPMLGVGVLMAVLGLALFGYGFAV